ncbi:wHTH domain-containing protein [Micromonospora echinofusca]|uniref:wHTH domain-containing protein n=1 Tax=Micromonospora echinofusca TaxID=47858 RepID=UPI0033F1B260
MSTHFHALLVGVPFYQDTLISDLPFIRNDLRELEESLQSVGYQTTVHDPDLTDGQSIDSAVEIFLADAPDAATVLIFLSGHGIHNDGMDYLVPAGALTRSYHFPDRCVAINFNGYIERSRAGDVIVVVDACREGIHVKEKGVYNAVAWTNRKIEAVAGRTIAYVYACSPGENARYVGEGSGAFSLFSRAFSQVVGAPAGPRTLAEVAKATQQVLDKLTSDHEYPHQNVRVLGESVDRLLVLDRPLAANEISALEHPWVTAAESHPAWEKIAENRHGPSKLREHAIRLVAHLAAGYDADSRVDVGEADPWQDAELAVRMTARIRWFIAHVLNPDKLALSAAEAAYLVLIPFLHAALWSRNVVRTATVVRPGSMTSGRGGEVAISFDDFAETYSRLMRRVRQLAEKGDAAGVNAIRWWIFHRWLVRNPSCYDDDLVGNLVSPVHEWERVDGAQFLTEVLTPPKVATTLRSIRADMASLTVGAEEAGPVRLRHIASATEFEQPLREQLVSCLSAAAYRFAIDPTMLPEVVVDHIGVTYAVEASEVVESIRSATWEGRGRTRILSAQCPHAAVDVALREHVLAVDDLLAKFDLTSETDALLAPLADMPTHAAADGVRPEVRNGHRRYDSTGLRFHLADDRIQELLMGEQLYGDPALAIRELYQNALDACRYKDARIRYLKASGSRARMWSGRITVTQGIDDGGRRYIECADNGIGMGMRELTEVFSHAGFRFADLPEYIEEQAEWKRYGIELFPNSRFGIGVLSYFMLADDISVTTTRMHRGGRVGKRLLVQIAGPGSLFQIKDLGPSEESGTTVRLYLKEGLDISALNLLGRVLWLADYKVEARNEETRLEWEPAMLSKEGLAIANRRVKPSPTSDKALTTAFCPSSSSTVWWCQGRGGILADGLWVGTAIHGAVVNLTGRLAPSLTVDRKEILTYSHDDVSAMLNAELDSLIDSAPEIFSHSWLKAVARSNPRLADAAFRRAMERGVPTWQLAGRRVDFRLVGVFPADNSLLSLDRHSENYARRRWIESLPQKSLLDWRFAAWLEAGVFPGFGRLGRNLPVAMPSDAYLFSGETGAAGEPRIDLREEDNYRYHYGNQQSWLIPDSTVSPGHILAVSISTGRSPRELAQRLIDVGFSTGAIELLPEKPTAADVDLLDTGGYKHRWLPADTPVPVGYILAKAQQLDLPVQDIAGKLVNLGFELEQPIPDGWGPQDLTLISEDLDGNYPYLSNAIPVPYHHVLKAMIRLQLTAAGITDALKRLNFDTSLAEFMHGRQYDEHDVVLASRDLDGERPWLERGVRVGLARILDGTSTGLDPIAVSERYRNLGFEVPSIDHVRLDDQEELIALLGGRNYAQTVDASTIIPNICIIRAAYDQRLPISEVRERLSFLGLEIPSDPLEEDHPSSRLLRSLRVNGTWLDPGAPVPALHILRLMAEFGLSKSDAMSWMRRAGLDPGEPPWPEHLSKQAARIAATLLDRPRHFRGFDEDRHLLVRPFDICRIAVRSRDSVGVVSQELDALGFEVPSFLPRELKPNDDDLDVVSVIDTMVVPAAHIAIVAHTRRLPLSRVFKAVRRLGLQPPAETNIPERLSPDVLKILSEDVDGNAPWLPTSDPVGIPHLLSCVAQTGWELHKVVDTLAALGMQLPELVLASRNPVERSDDLQDKDGSMQLTNGDE